ncbi:MAG: hypothetical protein EA416_11200 [Trueperaceae bacterium]|nr:MAG: hypothetical protein EA416_11200 [Trueperaceae bacterium]
MTKLLFVAILTASLAFGIATAHDAAQTIDLEMMTIGYWHVVEIEWARDEPLSSETSTFDGRCSVPSDYLAQGYAEGLTFPTGPFTSETEHCGQLIWEEEDGERLLRGRLTTDGFMTLRSDDGSVMTASFYANESSFDPVMGVFLHGMHFTVESMTGVPGLAFVEGAIRMTFVMPDIAALLTESAPAIGAGHGTASFVLDAAD